MVSGPPNALKCLLIAVGLALAAHAIAADCEEWSTGEFFERVTVAELRECLEGGWRVEARGYLLRKILRSGSSSVNSPRRSSCNPLR